MLFFAAKLPAEKLRVVLGEDEETATVVVPTEPVILVRDVPPRILPAIPGPSWYSRVGSI